MQGSGGELYYDREFVRIRGASVLKVKRRRYRRDFAELMSTIHCIPLCLSGVVGQGRRHTARVAERLLW